MKEIDIIFNSPDDVKSFIDTIICFDGKVFIYSGRYRIDAKSVVGVFSLGLKKPFVLEIEKWKEEYITLLDRYLYDEEERVLSRKVMCSFARGDFYVQ